jgi:hypothetical protein
VLLVVLVALVAGAGCRAAQLEVAALREGPNDFQLVAAESVIYFVGIKNNAVAVPGSFSTLSGRLDVVQEAGFVEVGIGTLSTGDPERDQNIVDHVFGGSEYPLARFDIEGESGSRQLPPVGGSVDLEVSGVLSLRGVETALSVKTRLTRVAENRLRVRNLGPFVLTKSQLGLEQAFDVLQAVCGHQALSGAVPIELDLVFESQS